MISHHCGGITPDYFLGEGVPYTRFVNYRDFVKSIEKQNREASKRG